MKEMRMILKSLILLACFAVLVPSAWAQDPAAAIPASGIKMAFMNFAQVLEGTEEAKGEIAKVRVFMDEKQRDFDQRASELEQLKQQFAAQERTLNAQTRAEMQRTIGDKERDMRRYQEDTQTEINAMRDELFGRLTNKIQPILADYAQQNGYGAIFFLDQLNGYFNPALDITQDVIRIYNERFPSASAPSN